MENKMKKKKIVVGMTKLPIFTILLFWIIVILYIQNVWNNLYFLYLFKVGDTTKGIIALIINLLLLLIFIPILIRFKEYWFVEENYIGYFSLKKVSEQVQYYLYRLLRKQNKEYDFKIDVATIDYITIHWIERKRNPNFAYISYAKNSPTRYSILLDIYLDDGTIISFDSLLKNSNKKEFILAINYLKEKGVNINDTINLLDVIETSDISIFNYIQQIQEKEKNIV